ncbi:MAG: glycerophosphoryl diester phosphodiesterase membrane domain-containing protein [Coriobacteriia bacterium]|nr:glycerophosphoryl diester phosphodiesterase membrane domain-containing protein [Coriobacteriia bacterium]
MKFKKFLHRLIKSIGMRFKLLLFNARPLIIFELLFNVVTTSIVSPLLFLCFRLAMKISGFNFVNADNFGQFMLNPITLLFVILLILIVATISLVDISAAIFVFECSRQKKKTTLKDTIVFSFKNAVRMFIPKNLLLIFVVLVILPLVSIGVGSNFIGQYSLPSNFKEYLLSNIWIVVLSLLTLAIFVFLSMKWVFAIHYFTLEKKDFIPSIKCSWHLLRGNTIRNFVSIMIVQIVIALLTKLLNICGSAFVKAIGQTFGSHTLIGCFGISVASIAFLIVYLILYALFLPYACLKVSALFYERKKAAGETIYNLNCKNINIGSIRKKQMIIGFIIIVVLSILFFTATLFYAQKMPRHAEIETREIIADRKALMESTENSIGAIKSASKLGANAIEVDIQISNDNITFLGIKQSINPDKNYDEITQNKTRAFTKEGIMIDSICTLKEAIACAKENNINLILDISEIDYKDNKIDIILNAIKDNKNICRISSTKYDDIVEIKKHDQEIKTIFKIGSAIGDFSEFNDADTLGFDLWVVDNTTVKNIHGAGKKIIVLDIQAKNKIEDATKLQIDGLTTMRVQNAVELNSTNGMPKFMYAFADYF